MHLEHRRPRHRLPRPQHLHDLLCAELRARRELRDRHAEGAQPAHRGDEPPDLGPGGFVVRGPGAGEAPVALAGAFVPLQADGADGVEALGEEPGGEGEEGPLLVEAELVVGVEDGDGLDIAVWWISRGLRGVIQDVRLATC